MSEPNEKPVLSYAGKKRSRIDEWFAQGAIAYLSVIGMGLNFVLLFCFGFFERGSWALDLFVAVVAGVFVCWVSLAVMTSYRVRKAQGGPTVVDDVAAIRRWMGRRAKRKDSEKP